MSWYGRIEKVLAPTRGIATISLLIILLVSLYLIFSKSNTARAAWVAYVFSP